MTKKAGQVLAALALALFGVALASAVAHGAPAHQSGCHSQHTCPSDHHTYLWTDTTTGLLWDCVEPGASEYNAARDTTVIVYQGLTYYCRSSGTATTSTLATTIATTASESTSTSTTATVTSTTTTTIPEPQLVLPDPTITPGALNAEVRQSTIRRTICKSGWTKTIRPPTSYTNTLKIKQMALYGEGGSPSDYEEDHFIPLELGGAPRNPKNLWPEAHSQSKLSDPLENRLKRQVCKGVMKLAKARAAIRLFKNTQG